MKSLVSTKQSKTKYTRRLMKLRKVIHFRVSRGNFMKYRGHGPRGV